mmetsp:Transcript_15047/g.35625  ORF Transcript_15047/g.35625 Transcript_15047/m.35625 type:complete len:469 (-) Transcript_15047:155-1561(-)
MRQAAAARLANPPQFAQHFQRQGQPLARRVRPQVQAAGQAGCIGGQDRPQQHDDPAQIDPDQEDRYGREGAVQRRIGRHLFHIPGQQRLRQREADRHEGAAKQGVAPAHMGVGHVMEEPGHGQAEQHDVGATQQCRKVRRHLGDHTLADADRIAGQRQAAAQQQRAERHRGPVDQHPLGHRPRALNPPDRVQRAVDGQHQRQRADAQGHQADRAELAGLGRELRQRAQHRLGDVGRNQALQEVLLQRRLEARKHRKGREDGEHHRQQRHQRDQGREGQAAGRESQLFLAEALAEGVQRLQPGPGQQVGDEAARKRNGVAGQRRVGAVAGRKWQGHGFYDAAVMPTARERTQPTAIERLSRNLALSATLALLLLCVAWELWLVPVGRGTLALKALPLLLPLAGLWRYRLYTYRALALFIWLYMLEGLVRATSEAGLGRWLALAEVGLSLAVFVACSAQIRLRLAAAKAA